MVTGNKDIITTGLNTSYKHELSELSTYILNGRDREPTKSSIFRPVLWYVQHAVGVDKCGWASIRIIRAVKISALLNYANMQQLALIARIYF